MRIAFVTVGTPGDVLPVIALARAFHLAGHTVRVASLAQFRAAVQHAGLDFHLLQGDSAAVFGGRMGITVREMISRPATFVKLWNTWLASFVRTHLRETWEACEGFDTAICTPWFHAAPTLAEKLGRPCFATTPMPPVGLSTRAFSNFYDGIPAASDRASTNNNQEPSLLRTWRTGYRILSAVVGQLNEWRVHDLKLPPLSSLQAIRAYRNCPFLLNYSPVLLPKPTDWPAHAYVTGFWSANGLSEWRPSPELLAFLERYPAPVLAGFSSQCPKNGARFTQSIVEATGMIGRGAILLANWGGIQTLPDKPSHVLQLDSLPHEWVAPRLSAFLHHGGCGTTAVAMRYGVPQVVIPFGFDQILWGQRIHELGLGPEPLSPETFTVDQLYRALGFAISDPVIHGRTTEVARELATENGFETAIKLVERLVS